MQHYSAANYWTPGWVFPRERLREPFPRRRRRHAAQVLAAVAHIPLPDVVARAPSRGQAWLAPARGETFQPASRGTVFFPVLDR